MFPPPFISFRMTGVDTFANEKPVLFFIEIVVNADWFPLKKILYYSGLGKNFTWILKCYISCLISI